LRRRWRRAHFDCACGRPGSCRANTDAIANEDHLEQRQAGRRRPGTPSEVGERPACPHRRRRRLPLGPGHDGLDAHRQPGIESVALDPNDDQPIYIATGKHTFEANGRIFASSDRGGTWKHVDLPFPLGGGNPGRAMDERLMVVPHLPSMLFHGSRSAGM
jgi:hypothetical protein